MHFKKIVRSQYTTNNKRPRSGEANSKDFGVNESLLGMVSLLIPGCVMANYLFILFSTSFSSAVHRNNCTSLIRIVVKVEEILRLKIPRSQEASINVWGRGKHPRSRSLGKNDKDSSGHLDACISIMDLLSGSVLRLSINSFSTSVRHRANADNGVSILLTK